VAGAAFDATPLHFLFGQDDPTEVKINLVENHGAENSVVVGRVPLQLMVETLVAV
jgi:hypothetical protein